jgi:hypothetical protein
MKEKISGRFVQVSNLRNLHQEPTNYGVSHQDKTKKFPPALAQHNL